MPNGDSVRLALVCEQEPSPLLERMLGGFGAPVARVRAGAEIGKRCVAADPTVVIIHGSFGMALEYAAELRSTEGARGLPVVVLTTDWPGLARAALLEHGVFCCLEPPYPLGELRARITASIALGQHVATLERTSRVDALTGLWNRASFERQLATAMASSERSRGPLALALGDLDHFKRLNDTYGHAAGDAVLRQFAATLRNCTRQGDIACRYGGEEFAVIFPDTTLSEAVAVCQRVRRVTESCEVEGVPAPQFTVSFGVTSQAIESPLSAEALVRAADAALYDAKHAGRNRVHCVPGEMGPVRMAS